MPDRDRARILLVEDNPADVFLLKEALRTHGVNFDLLWFSDGEAASTHFEQFGPDGTPPDIILLDLNVPKVDGKELLARIRNHPCLAAIKVGILTSSDSPRDRSELERLGANWYLRKPPSLDEFLGLGGTIRSLIEA